MNPKRWQQASRILETALERNPEQLAAYLDEVCANDAELRREVESLLAASAQAGSLLDSPAIAMAAPLFLNDFRQDGTRADRKSTRLNSSHVKISYAVFCLKKK